MEKQEDDRSSNVRVGVRVRPILSQEAARDEAMVVSHPSANQVMAGRNKVFTYDYVFPAPCSQSDVYQSAVQQLLDSCFQGFNVTILAYGQTGSGKTYSMGTGDETSASTADSLDDNAGILPRFVKDLFITVQGMQDKRKVTCSVSMLEIYNEIIIDLLDKQGLNDLEGEAQGSSGGREEGKEGGGGGHRSSRSGGAYTRRGLQIREDAKAGIMVSGLREISVDSANAVLEVLHMGSLVRHTASTLMNQASSRSHAVFTITLESTPIQETNEGDTELSTADEVTGHFVSKITFVDLAGSERLKKTQAEGERMREGISINVGLLALGNVINALGDETRRQREGSRLHVPYRDSKLTRLLQDGLGGNSRTLFIACVSPAESNLDETINTLRYAYRARNIRNKPVVNMDPHAELVMAMRRHIQILQLESLRQHFNRPPLAPALPPLASAMALASSEEGKQYLAEVLKEGEDLGPSLAVSIVPIRTTFSSGQAYPATPPRLASPAAAFTSPPSASGKETKSDRSTPKGGRPPLPSTVKSPPRGQGASKKGAKGHGKRRPTAAHSGSDKEEESKGNTSDEWTKEDHRLAAMEAFAEEDTDSVFEMEAVEHLIALEKEEARFGASQEAGQARLREMTTTISSKEQLLEQLKSSLQNYHGMKRRMDALLANLQQTEEEKARLQEQVKKHADDVKHSERQLAELEVKVPAKFKNNPLSPGGSSSPEAAAAAQAREILRMKRGAEKEGKRALSALENQLRRLRDERSKMRNKLVLAERQASRMEKLKNEITSLKAARVQISRQLKEAEVKHRGRMAAMERQVTSLRRSAGKQRQQISRIQSESQRKSLLLTRRKDLLSTLQRKLKDTENQLLRVLRRQRQRQEAHRRNTQRGRGQRATPRATDALNEGIGATEEGLNEAVISKRKALWDIIDRRVKAVEAEHSLALALEQQTSILRDIKGLMERRDMLLMEIEENKGSSQHQQGRQQRPHAGSSTEGDEETERASTDTGDENFPGLSTAESFILQKKREIGDLDAELEVLQTQLQVVDSRVQDFMARVSHEAAAAITAQSPPRKPRLRRDRAYSDSESVTSERGNGLDHDETVSSHTRRRSLQRTSTNISMSSAEGPAASLDDIEADVFDWLDNVPERKGHKDLGGSRRQEKGRRGKGRGSGGRGGKRGGGRQQERKEGKDAHGSSEKSLTDVDGIVNGLSGEEARMMLRSLALEVAEIRCRENMLQVETADANQRVTELLEANTVLRKRLSEWGAEYTKTSEEMANKYERQMLETLRDSLRLLETKERGRRGSRSSKRRSSDTSDGSSVTEAVLWEESKSLNDSSDGIGRAASESTDYGIATPGKGPGITVDTKEKDRDEEEEEEEEEEEDGVAPLSSALNLLQTYNERLEGELEEERRKRREAEETNKNAQQRYTELQHECSRLKQEAELLRLALGGSQEGAAAEGPAAAVRKLSQAWDDLGASQSVRDAGMRDIGEVLQQRCEALMADLLASQRNAEELGAATEAAVIALLSGIEVAQHEEFVADVKRSRQLGSPLERYNMFSLLHRSIARRVVYILEQAVKVEAALDSTVAASGLRLGEFRGAFSPGASAAPRGNEALSDAAALAAWAKARGLRFDAKAPPTASPSHAATEQRVAAVLSVPMQQWCELFQSLTPPSAGSGTAPKDRRLFFETTAYGGVTTAIPIISAVALSEGRAKEWSEALAELKRQMARRRLAVQGLTELLSPLLKELHLTPQVIKQLARRIPLRHAVVLAIQCCAGNAEVQELFVPPAEFSVSTAAMKEAAAIVADVCGAMKDVDAVCELGWSRIAAGNESDAVEEVGEGEPQLLHEIAETIMESSDCHLVDYLSVIHVLVLAALLLSIRSVAVMAIARRETFVNRCFAAVEGGLEVAGRFIGAASIDPAAIDAEAQAHAQIYSSKARGAGGKPGSKHSEHNRSNTSEGERSSGRSTSVNSPVSVWAPFLERRVQTSIAPSLREVHALHSLFRNSLEELPPLSPARLHLCQAALYSLSPVHQTLSTALLQVLHELQEGRNLAPESLQAMWNAMKSTAHDAASHLSRWATPAPLHDDDVALAKDPWNVVQRRVQLLYQHLRMPQSGVEAAGSSGGGGGGGGHSEPSTNDSISSPPMRSAQKVPAWRSQSPAVREYEASVEALMTSIGRGNLEIGANARAFERLAQEEEASPREDSCAAHWMALVDAVASELHGGWWRDRAPSADENYEYMRRVLDPWCWAPGLTMEGQTYEASLLSSPRQLSVETEGGVGAAAEPSAPSAPSEWPSAVAEEQRPQRWKPSLASATQLFRRVTNSIRETLGDDNANDAGEEGQSSDGDGDGDGSSNDERHIQETMPWIPRALRPWVSPVPGYPPLVLTPPLAQGEGGGPSRESIRAGPGLAFAAIQSCTASMSLAVVCVWLWCTGAGTRDILRLYARVAALETAMVNFESSVASHDGDRFKGNSIKFLREEEFRRYASKEYPRLVKLMLKRVQSWEEEHGETMIVRGISILKRLQTIAGVSTATPFCHSLCSAFYKLLQANMELLRLALYGRGLQGGVGGDVPSGIGLARLRAALSPRSLPSSPVSAGHSHHSGSAGEGPHDRPKAFQEKDSGEEGAGEGEEAQARQGRQAVDMQQPRTAWPSSSPTRPSSSVQGGLEGDTLYDAPQQPARTPKKLAPRSHSGVSSAPPGSPVDAWGFQTASEGGSLGEKGQSPYQIRSVSPLIAADDEGEAFDRERSTLVTNHGPPTVADLQEDVTIDDMEGEENANASFAAATDSEALDPSPSKQGRPGSGRRRVVQRNFGTKDTGAETGEAGRAGGSGGSGGSAPSGPFPAARVRLWTAPVKRSGGRDASTESGGGGSQEH